MVVSAVLESTVLGNCINRSAKPPQAVLVLASISRTGWIPGRGLGLAPAFLPSGRPGSRSSKSVIVGRSTGDQMGLDMARCQIFEAMFQTPWRWSGLNRLAGSINLCWGASRVVGVQLRLPARACRGRNRKPPERPRPPGVGAGAAQRTIRRLEAKA